MKFLLFGMYGAVNVGDELVEYAVGRSIADRFPDARFIVASSNPTLSERFNPLENVSYYKGLGFSYRFWLYLPRTIRLFSRTDVIVIGGGGLFQDQYSWRLPAGAVLNALLGMAFKKKVCIVGIGAGPLKRPWLRTIIGKALSQADLVCVRDQKGFACLSDLGVPEDKIEWTADVVPSIQLRSLLESRTDNKQQRVTALILRDWPGISYAKTAELLTELVQHGYHIDVHCFEPVQDSRFYDKILNHCSKETLRAVSKVIPQTLQQTVQRLNEAEFIISMRLHGCVLAAGLGIPFMPVEYEKKVRSFAEQIGLSPIVTGTKDLDPTLMERISSAKQYWQDHNSEIKERWKTVQDDAGRNFEKLAQTVTAQQQTRPSRFVLSLGKLLAIAFILEVCHLVSWPFKRLERENA